MNSKPEDWYLIQSCRLFFRRWTLIITVCVVYSTRVVPPRSATIEEMVGFHAEDYIQFLSLLGHQTDEEKLEEESEQYGLSMIINIFFSVLMLLFFCHLYILLLATFYSIDLARFRTDFSQLIPCQLNTQNVNLYQKYTFVYS